MATWGVFPPSHLFPPWFNDQARQVHGVPAHPGRRQDLRLRQREVSQLGAGRATVP